MVLGCSCNHPAQDSFYGPGRRVHTTMKNGNQRCTVCLSEKSPEGSDAKKKK